MGNKRTLRSVAVPLGITALLATSLTACAGSPEDASAGVCVDPETQVRVDDDYCDDDDYHGSGSAFAWYFLAYGRTAPAVGGPVSGGTFTKPSGSYVKGGVSKSGGSVSSTIRGGFSSGKVSGGGFSSGGRGFGG